MDAQAIRDILQTDLLFVVLPVALGFTFNFVTLFLIINADRIWQSIASARRTRQQSGAQPDSATRPHPNSVVPND